MPPSQDLRDDGGPVFPVANANPELAGTGLSLREYFAAHAPPPPDWWESPAIDRDKLPACPEVSALPPEDQMLVGQWFNFARGDLPKHLHEFEDRMRVYQDAFKETNIRRQAEAYFAWRYYYADQMLAHRLQPSPPLPVYPWRAPRKEVP